MEQPIEKHILIDASPDTVWRYLTEPELIKSWMGDEGMNVEIITDWVVGHSILIKGFHHGPFENKGPVIQFEPGKLLQYSHLSSVSRLPDSPENYTVMTFHLKPENTQTRLSIHIENFPTESIYQHLNFYWTGTLSILKQVIEGA
jgi:uncharacterized protein YndB with AHSA1/START domain